MVAKRANRSRFADKNLAFATLDSLHEGGLVDRPAAPDGEEGVYNEAVARALLAVVPEPALLARLRVLTWTPQSPSVSEVYPQWDGEMDEFDIGHLSGIEACGRLGVVSLELFAGGRGSLEPLAALSRLKVLRLRPTDAIADLRPICALEGLELADLGAVRVSTQNERALDRLGEAGARVLVGGKVRHGGRRPMEEQGGDRGADSAEQLLDLEQQALEHFHRGRADERVRCMQTALEMRERLAAAGRVAAGATRTAPGPGPERVGVLRREGNVLAGVLKLADAVECAGRGREARELQVRGARMLLEAGRSDGDAIAHVVEAAERSKKARRRAEVAELARGALDACQRAGGEEAEEVGWLCERARRLLA